MQWPWEKRSTANSGPLEEVGSPCEGSMGVEDKDVKVPRRQKSMDLVPFQILPALLVVAGTLVGCIAQDWRKRRGVTGNGRRRKRQTQGPPQAPIPSGLQSQSQSTPLSKKERSKPKQVQSSAGPCEQSGTKSKKTPDPLTGGSGRVEQGVGCIRSTVEGNTVSRNTVSRNTVSSNAVSSNTVSSTVSSNTVFSSVSRLTTRPSPPASSPQELATSVPSASASSEGRMAPGGVQQCKTPGCPEQGKTPGGAQQGKTPGGDKQGSTPGRAQKGSSTAGSSSKQPLKSGSSASAASKGRAAAGGAQQHPSTALSSHRRRKSKRRPRRREVTAREYSWRKEALIDCMEARGLPTDFGLLSSGTSAVVFNYLNGSDETTLRNAMKRLVTEHIWNKKAEKHFLDAHRQTREYIHICKTIRHPRKMRPWPQALASAEEIADEQYLKKNRRQLRRFTKLWIAEAKKNGSFRGVAE